MLRTLPQTREWSITYRLLAIALFTALTFVGAKLRIEIGAVPFTLQTLFVLLAGMVLGARDGAMSQLLYVLLIILGLPLDSRGLGPAVFAGPTWGYIVGWVPAAFVVGWIVEHSNNRFWQRLLAALIGSIIFFVTGVIVLKYNLNLEWSAAIADGFIKFIPEAIGKALIASALAEGGRALLARWDV